MTRGQRGSLILRRMALSSTTPRRFIPAHGTPVPLVPSRPFRPARTGSSLSFQNDRLEAGPTQPISHGGILLASL